MDRVFLHFFVIGVSLAGFAIAFYIHFKKSRQELLICPFGADCNKVIESKYSTTLRIPNDSLGMAYYALIAYVYWVNSGTGVVLLTIITGVAALFSLYLIFMQFLKLRAWCEWCVLSTIITLIIFFIQLIL